MGGQPEIRAAGAVLWRYRDVLEIALVHRPRYGDWSLPKGKLESGESDLAAAVREVGEETGSAVAVGRRIGRSTYRVGGARKSVTWWAMRYLDGSFAPNSEVDELVWLPVAKARARLAYSIERGVVSEFLSLPVPDSVVVLVRHAKAGKRSQWDGADELRPLEATGQAQAARLIDFARPFRPDRVLSADRTRCVQTVEPLASALGLTVVVDAAFSDEAFAAAPDHAEAALLALAKPGQVSVVCSQGAAIPGLIASLAPSVRATTTRKGAAWVLSVADGQLVSADYYADASR